MMPIDENCPENAGYTNATENHEDSQNVPVKSPTDVHDANNRVMMPGI